MTEKRAVELANKFVSAKFGRFPKLLGVEKSPFDEKMWDIVYDLSPEGETWDGPLVILLNENTEEISVL